MYYSLLTKIRNAGAAKKDTLKSSFSKTDFAVAKVLVQAKYAGDVQKKNVGKYPSLDIKLAYKGGKSVINGYKIMSKPGRRLYVDYRSLRPVKQGYGLAVISTSAGIMSGEDAKKNKLGGEYLFQVW